MALYGIMTGMLITGSANTIINKWQDQTVSDCNEKVSADQFNVLAKADQDNLCKKEQETVAGFLKNDSVNFRSIINERITAISSEPHH